MRCGLVLLLILTGCTAEYEAGAAAGAKHAATVADNALEAAEWAWCKAQSHGAVMRRYYGMEKKWNSRVMICWPDMVR